MKVLLIVATLLVPVCGLGSVGIVLEGTGWIDMDGDKIINPHAYDVQKDGTPELILHPSWDVLLAVTKTGTPLWTYTLDPSEVCPQCGTEPEYWSVEFYEFIDTEPGHFDAVIRSSYNNWDSGFSWNSLGLVSASNGTLRQQIVGKNFRGCVDLDDDGYLELLVQQNNAGSEGYFEVWGYGSISGIQENAVPSSAIELKPNRPNPFNPSTRLQFALRNPGEVRIEFFDSAGRQVDSADLGHLPSGPHEFTWWGRNHEGRTLPSGSYFYSVVSGGQRQSRKILLLK